MFCHFGPFFFVPLKSVPRGKNKFKIHMSLHPGVICTSFSSELSQNALCFHFHSGQLRSMTPKIVTSCRKSDRLHCNENRAQLSLTQSQRKEDLSLSARPQGGAWLILLSAERWPTSHVTKKNSCAGRSPAGRGR